MSLAPKKFYLESYDFDRATATASFYYSFDHQSKFVEQVEFGGFGDYDQALLDRALRLAHLIVGVSYYKSFPLAEIDADYELSPSEVGFVSEVYRHGLSQFIYENKLDPNQIGRVAPEIGGAEDQPVDYDGQGILSMQSGGKDSLLMAELLSRAGQDFSTFFITSSDFYPQVLDKLDADLRLARRKIDIVAIRAQLAEGGLNGHVPVTYIAMVYALIDAILHGENTILAAIGREGEEPHALIGDFAITHQWSKTWRAEKMFAEQVARAVSPDIKIGSPLRKYSELKIAELFAEYAWPKFASEFSSCNVANYQQGNDNRQLKWCGRCPKCANSYLLFAPFVEPGDLQAIFAGKNLFLEPELQATFKALLGVGEAIKPFECVGEVAELRLAYHMAQQRYAEAGKLSFTVPETDYDYQTLGPGQDFGLQLG